MNDNTTIVALSTPVGRSAIAVVRMSGDKAKNIAAKIFSPMPQKPNLMKVGNLQLDGFTERAMCVYFDAPHSYTGEDTVEFHCHGGTAICTAAIQKCLECGAVMAKNGEFSKRSFINGKQNLSNAEGIIEMIDAETAAAAKAGADLLENKLGKITVELQDKLVDMIAETEAALDYPEEDIEKSTAEQLRQKIAALLQQTQNLLDTVKVGKIVKYGISVAITGKPNVGKSSLLNAILGRDRAIVSSTPGTTRDTLEASVNYRDTKINFVDTAGLRETADPLEKEGVKRAEKAAENADVVLHVVDDPADESKISSGKKVIKIYNKCDLFARRDFGKNALALSAKTGENVEKLKEMLYLEFAAGGDDGFILTNERHADCIKRANEALKNAMSDIAQNKTLDCVAATLREAYETLGEITGSTANEEIIDRIFSKFCLGK